MKRNIKFCPNKAYESMWRGVLFVILNINSDAYYIIVQIRFIKLSVFTFFFLSSFHFALTPEGDTDGVHYIHSRFAG